MYGKRALLAACIRVPSEGLDEMRHQGIPPKDADSLSPGLTLHPAGIAGATDADCACSAWPLNGALPPIAPRMSSWTSCSEFMSMSGVAWARNCMTRQAS